METYPPDYFDVYLSRYQKDLHDLRRKEKVLKHLEPKEGERILDLGAGVGAFAGEIQSASAAVVSLDCSLHALTLARRHYHVRSPVCADVISLPFQEASFHKVLLTELIEHDLLVEGPGAPLPPAPVASPER